LFDLHNDMFSIVTPTFNRKNRISNSIDSSLSFINKDDNVIIVDDASNDGTGNFIKNKYGNFIDNNSIQYYLLQENNGVTYAKNFGASKSEKEWVIFLDSDDCLLERAYQHISNAIETFQDVDVFFFRCENHQGEVVGPILKESYVLNLNEYVNNGTPGECIPVIKKKTLGKYPYTASLRGFESLSYLKMIRDGVKVMVVNEIVRKYSDFGEDRLSTKFNLFLRSDKLLQGRICSYNILKDCVTLDIKIKLIFKIVKLKVISLILSAYLLFKGGFKHK
jgi:glycosyltransferase involved in cell wall biosynthesis